MISAYPGCNFWCVTEAGGGAYNAAWQMHERLAHEFSNILDYKTANKQDTVYRAYIDASTNFSFIFGQFSNAFTKIKIHLLNICDLFSHWRNGVVVRASAS